MQFASDADRGTGTANYKINLTDRIASTGTETKAYAPESGYDSQSVFVIC